MCGVPNCIQTRVDIGNYFKVRLQLLVHLQWEKGLIQLSNSLLNELKESFFCNILHVCNVLQVWEIVYAKDGSVKELSNVMQLKGHKV